MLPLSTTGDIPPSHGRIDITTSPMLIWTMTGSARITVDDADYDVPAGHSVRVPAARRVEMRTTAGTVTFPILLPRSGPGEASTVTFSVVPPEWDDGLVHEFVWNLGYLRGSPELPRRLLDTSGTESMSPPVPHTPALFEVAHIILRAPAADRSTSDLAAEVGISTRTLQRRFVEETGYTLTRWRIRARIAASIELLATGRDIGWVANEVGFLTASGFIRAFTAQHGTSPRRYRPPESSAPDWATPPAIPAAATWPRVNGAHVAVWMYRGRGCAKIGEHRLDLDEGDAVILPAGIQNSITLDEGSLLIPLGFRPPHIASFEDPKPVRFTRMDEQYLLHRVVSTYTPLRPHTFDRTEVFDSIAAPTASDMSGSLVSQLAARVARNPSDTRTLTDWAELLGADATTLRREFRTKTGSTFPQWRAMSRMTQARNQLQLGVAPTVVARRLGYSHLPAFSRAFTTAHGISPQQALRACERNSITLY